MSSYEHTPDGRNSCVFCTGLGPEIDDHTITSYFNQFAPVFSAKVMLDVNTGLSRGFAFLQFMNETDARTAAHYANGRPGPGNRMLRAELTRHDVSHLLMKTRKILVRNIPASLSKEYLEEYFAYFGQVLQLQARPDPTTMTPCHSLLVEFNSVEQAAAAVNAIHGKRAFPDCSVPVLAKFAEPYNNRRERLLREKDQQRGSNTPYQSTPPPSSLVPDHHQVPFMPAYQTESPRPFRAQYPDNFIAPVPLGGEPSTFTYSPYNAHAYTYGHDAWISAALHANLRGSMMR